MTRVSPAETPKDPDVADYMRRWIGTKGYAPNAWQTMLRRPRVFLAYRDLHTVVMMDEGEVSKALKFMVAEVVSNAAGCFYCTAHNAENALKIGGVGPEKIKDLWLYKTSAHFSEAERAALDLAHAAGSHPPSVEDAHFDALKKHFSEDAIVEIVAVISLLGWLNRWNQTMDTAIEPASLTFGEEHLAASGWAPRPEDRSASDSD